MSEQEVLDKLANDMSFTAPEMRARRANLYLQDYSEHADAIIRWVGENYPDLKQGEAAA